VISFLSQPWRVTCAAVSLFGEIEGEQRAASFAYYALFSLFPLLALLLTVGSVFVDPVSAISAAEKIFPMDDGQRDLVWKMSESLQRARGGVGLASLLVLVWSSLRFFQALVQGVNRAWHRTLLPWWKLPVKNLLMMGVVASALGLGLVVPAILQAMLKTLLAAQVWLGGILPLPTSGEMTILYAAGRYVLAGGLVFYALVALYMLAPGRKIYFRQVWLAALTVAIALQVGQSLFGNYVAKIVNYNAIYGSVGALMLALMWVYLAGVMILLGSCFCAAADGGGETTPSSSEN
jgi:YihY family inner membrane protein